MPLLFERLKWLFHVLDYIYAFYDTYTRIPLSCLIVEAIFIYIGFRTLFEEIKDYEQI